MRVFALFLLLTACTHTLEIPIPDHDSGFTAEGHEWWYERHNGIYTVYAEELEALTEVQARVCRQLCITTDLGGDMYEIR